jgi:amino acid transporter
MRNQLIPGEEENAGISVLQRPIEKKPHRSWRTWLIGRPLPTADAPHQTIGKAVGLAVFAGDALSSVAYAPQETLVILAAAGFAGFSYAVPIALAVTILLVIVTISYQQTIHAYPNGGGAYIVARDNLGEIAGLTAGSALLTDYVLLAAVAVSSGTAQIVSAYPSLFSYRVIVAVILILIIMVANLRGVKESGTAFAIPVYFFLVTTFLVIVIGFVRYFTRTLGMVVDPPEMDMMRAIQPVTLFLILRAFASGTTALTGVECVSNGVMAFKEPRSHNAAMALIWMSAILGVFFLGIAILLRYIGAVPSEAETVISQLARTAYGSRGFLYLCTIAGTTIILILATNTAFADFPRLAALIAADGFLPRQLAFRGSRLVFSNGIVALGVVACMLVILFRASVTALIPLWAIGVFLSFTLSQTGMALRWWKIGHLQPEVEVSERGSSLHFEPGWRLKMFVNGFGAFITAIVTIIFAVTKFSGGAWIIVFLIPILVAIFISIHRHYQILAANLALKRDRERVPLKRHRVILPISGVHEGTLAALNYARLLSDDITAVYISIDPKEAESIRKKWEIWGEGVRLVILDSPYRLLVEPLLEYITSIVAKRQAREIITIVVPQFVPRVWWHNLLHTQTATWLRLALLFKPGIVVTDVPYQVE